MNFPELILEREYKSLDNRQIEYENTDEFYPFNILIKIDNRKLYWVTNTSGNLIIEV